MAGEKDLTTKCLDGQGPPHGGIWLACFFCAALVVRAWALWARGVVDFDETYYYILGRNLFSGNGYTLNGLPHTAFGPLYPFLVGAGSFFGLPMRLATCGVTAVLGALVVVPVYLLARDIYGKRAARLSAGVAALWPSLFFFAACGGARAAGALRPAQGDRLRPAAAGDVGPGKSGGLETVPHVKTGLQRALLPFRFQRPSGLAERGGPRPALTWRAAWHTFVFLLRPQGEKD